MQSPHSSRLIPIGYIPKAHGIRGEVVLILEAESEEFLRGELFAFPRGNTPVTPLPKDCRKLAVQGLRRHHQALLASFSGVTTRTQAELLRRHTIFVLRENLAAATVYLHDLPGLRVFVQENGARRELGRIASADAPAGQELWVIATPKGGEVLFPAVPEFVVEMDLDAGTVCIDPPPGLLDLYLTER